jgi:pyruvate,water dikinase
VCGEDGLTGVEAGDVLVLPVALPAISQVLALVGALVCQEGGVLSNLAIVARELGIPCVIGAADAMHAIRHGDRVFVDADAGLVAVLARESTPRAAR